MTCGGSPPATNGPSSAFVLDMEKTVDVYTSKWQERNEEHNFQQMHDTELVKEELRPVVFEEIRQEVDAEVAIMLQNLKVHSLLQTHLSPRQMAITRKCSRQNVMPEARRARKVLRGRRARRAKRTRKGKTKKIQRSAIIARKTILTLLSVVGRSECGIALF